MQSRQSARTLFDLARVMVKQARMLRDMGFAARAREVARRAIDLDRQAWAMLRPAPKPVPVRIAASRLH